MVPSTVNALLIRRDFYRFEEMLLRRIFATSINSRITAPTQCINASVRLYSSSSNASSSDSSDSDSDVDTAKKVVQQDKSKTEINDTTLNNILDDLAKKMNGRETSTKKINVAVAPKKLGTERKNKQNKQLPYDVQLKQAAENVADQINKDKTQAKVHVKKLLDRLIQPQDVTNKKEKESLSSNLRQLLSDMEVHPKSTTRWQSKARTASRLTRSVEQHAAYNRSDTRSVKERSTLNMQVLHKSVPIGIFNNINKSVTDTPDLTTWKALEQRELDLLLHQPPRNVFQEMIQWTEEGKLWKFPIDNEIGMEEEHSVHFSEHVFLEHHLKGWCPTKGPIRHFMELVCVGLSKNPYMTVNEKLDHINWYKEYFQGKEDLLKELGAIDTSESNKSKDIEG